MKKSIILLSALFLTLNSCSDFLEEQPLSEITQDQYFTSPNHAYAAVNQLYRGGIQDLTFAASAYNGPKLMSGGYMSGFFDNPNYKGQEQFIVQSQSLSLNAQTSAGYLDGIWDPCYRAIARANFAIENIPVTPGLNDSERKQLLAEAYFFRAFNYFYLVKYFGDVPLIIDTNQEDMYVARSSSKIVYEQMITDLTYSSKEGNLNDLPMPKNNFRISKGTVNTLLADIYLHMSGFPVQENKYAEAATAAREIINSGNYRLIQNVNTTTNSAYNVMRTSDIEDEYMYQVEYMSGIATNGWMATYSFPTGAVSWPGQIFKFAITTEVFLPRPELLAIYDNTEDIRIQEKQFFHSQFTYDYSNSSGTNTETRNFPTMPYLWFDQNALFNSGQQDKDFKIYRYAEVLLIAAEAIAKTEGVTAEARRYLAQVRSRASLTGKSIEIVSTELAALSANQFIEEVWKERLREFPLEFKIWEDMQRTRKIMKTDINNKGVISFIDLIGATNTWGNTFQAKDLLYPISANELQRNPKLTQNEGY